MSEIFGGYGIAISLVAIMISVAGIILGVAYALDDRKLKDFGKGELYQALVNGAILGAVFMAFGQYGIVSMAINSLTSGVSPQSCGQSFNGNSAICFAYNYLIGSVFVNVNGGTYPSLMASTLALLAAVSGLYVMLGTLVSVKVSTTLLSVGLQGLGVFLGPLRETADFLALSTALIVAQAVILKFIAVTAVSALLPVGLTLRTFYFTRKLGGTIIAIAIGLYAILPLTYVLDAQLAYSYTAGGAGQGINSTISSLNSAASGARNIGSYAYSVGSSPAHGNTLDLNPLDGVISAVSSFSSSISSTITALSNAIALILVQVFFLPTLSIVLTAVSIREMAVAFGSEVSFGRLYIF